MENIDEYLLLVDNKKINNQKKTIDYIIDAYDEDEVAEINIFHLTAVLLLNKMNNKKEIESYKNAEILFEKLFKMADEFNQISLPVGTLKRIVSLINSYSVSDDFFLYLLEKYLINEEIIKNEYKMSSPFSNMVEDDKDKIKKEDDIYRNLSKIDYETLKSDQQSRLYHENLLDVFYKEDKNITEIFNDFNESKGLKK